MSREKFLGLLRQWRELKSDGTRPDGDSANCGFDEFWKLWPSHPRKVARQQCLQKWRTKRCAEISDRIIASLKAHIESDAWKFEHGKFIPRPLTWLNQNRWEADLNAKPYAKPPPKATLRAEMAGQALLVALKQLRTASEIRPKWSQCKRWMRRLNDAERSDIAIQAIVRSMKEAAANAHFGLDIPDD